MPPIWWQCGEALGRAAMPAGQTSSWQGRASWERDAGWAAGGAPAGRARLPACGPNANSISPRALAAPAPAHLAHVAGGPILHQGVTLGQLHKLVQQAHSGGRAAAQGETTGYWPAARGGHVRARQGSAPLARGERKRPLAAVHVRSPRMPCCFHDPPTPRSGAGADGEGWGGDGMGVGGGGACSLDHHGGGGRDGEVLWDAVPVLLLRQPKAGQPAPSHTWHARTAANHDRPKAAVCSASPPAGLPS